MVNVGFSWSSLLGITLAVAGAALYFLRSVRPSLARDHDIFFAAVGLLCGGILFFQGWRQDPILQFGQFLLTGSAIFFAVESIRLRNVATLQAKRNTRIVDDERPVSSAYTYVDAELDELEPAEEMPPRARIRGTQESRPSRSQGYEDEGRRRPPKRSRNDDRYGPEDVPPPSRSRSDDRYGPEDPPPSSRSRGEDRYGSEAPPGKRRSRPSAERPPASRSDEWDDSPVETEERPPRASSAGANRKPSDGARPRKKRPPQEERTSRRTSQTTDPTPGEYVDFQPIDSPDDEQDNTGNFDY